MFLTSDKCAFLLIVVGLLGVFQGAHGMIDKCKADMPCTAPANIGCSVSADGATTMCLPEGEAKLDKGDGTTTLCYCKTEGCGADLKTCQDSVGMGPSSPTTMKPGGSKASESGSVSVTSHQLKYLFVVPALLALGRVSRTN